MVKKLLKSGQVEVQDLIILTAVDEPVVDNELPVSDLWVSFSLWKLHKDHWSKHREHFRLGVILEPEQQGDDLVEQLDNIDQVICHFPAFTDGRHYSTARELRQRFGFTGNIIATGDVLLDQLHNLRRCGFDQFVLKHERDYAVAADYLEVFTQPYQRAVGD